PSGAEDVDVDELLSLLLPQPATTTPNTNSDVAAAMTMSLRKKALPSKMEDVDTMPDLPALQSLTLPHPATSPALSSIPCPTSCPSSPASPFSPPLPAAHPPLTGTFPTSNSSTEPRRKTLPPGTSPPTIPPAHSSPIPASAPGTTASPLRTTALSVGSK